MITAGDPRNSGEGLIAQFVRFAVAEAADRHAGSESVLTKLSELMFIDVLRRYLEKLPAEQAGWLAGLRDPLVGKALSLMHAKPAHDGRSRNWRSKQACRARFWPSDSCSSLEFRPCRSSQMADANRGRTIDRQQRQRCTIAAQIGYESEAAFSREFKKMIGVRLRLGAARPGRRAAGRLKRV